MELVNPIANTDDSTAEVFLEDDRLPALSHWTEQFSRIVNGRYELRGVEVTLQGTLEQCDEALRLVGEGQAAYGFKLVPLSGADKLQWSHTANSQQALDEEEGSAYQRLADAIEAHANDRVSTSVTGPLELSGGRYTLHVRSWLNLTTHSELA